MKGLMTLIRLAKRDLDELKRKQTEMQVQKERLEQAIKNLHAELMREQQLAAKMQEMASFYGGFAKQVKARELEIREEITKVDAELLKISDDIQLAFNELKKYEIALENVKARKRAEDDRKETIMFDDIAGQQFLKKMREEQ